MRFTSLIVLLLVAFVASKPSCVGAKETTPNNFEDVPAFNTDITDSDNKVRRLRRGQQVNNEERAPVIIPPGMMATNGMTETSQILLAAKNQKPLPKWAKALIVLAVLGAGTGVIVGAVKTQ